jgi:hypothetical protein
MGSAGMTEAEKKVREYLAAIGRRGGLASRRELSRSHAKTDGSYPGSETRRVESRKAVASSQSQASKTLLSISASIVSRL